MLVNNLEKENKKLIEFFNGKMGYWCLKWESWSVIILCGIVY